MRNFKKYLLLVLLFMSYMPLLFASEGIPLSDISGAWTGTSESDFSESCSESGSDSGSLVISNVTIDQNGSSFTSSFPFSTSDSSGTTSISGTIASDGHISGSATSSYVSGGDNFSGSYRVSGNAKNVHGTDEIALYLNGSASSGNEICSQNVFIELNRSTENATEVIGQTLIQSSVKQTTRMISQRIASIIRPIPFDRSKLVAAQMEEHNYMPVNASDIDGMFSSVKFNEVKPVDLQLSSGQMGLSAGDAAKTRGVWANISTSDIEDSSLSVDSDIDVDTYIGGYDQKLDDKTLIGVALTYENVSADTDYNNGNLSNDGYTISPYISYSITESMAVYAIAGYGWIDYEQDSNNKSTKSDVDAERSFVELNFMAFQNFDRVLLNERIGYLYTHESQDSYTEKHADGSTTKVKSNSITFSQIKANIEVAYAGEQLEPYFDIGYQYDTDYEKVSDVSYDRSGGEFTVGMRFFLSSQLMAEVTTTSNFDRNNIDETNFSGSIRYEF